MPAMIILLTLPNAIVATMIGVSFLANGGYKSTNPNPTRKRGIAPHFAGKLFPSPIPKQTHFQKIDLAMPTEIKLPSLGEGVESGDVLEIMVDRKSTRLNSSHLEQSRMPSSA